MQPAIADFMIHITETLSEADLSTLADTVCDDACVTSACVSHDNPHLILVNYDSNCASARDIVRIVASQGVHAQAVGL
jgi:hypothetical protein